MDKFEKELALIREGKTVIQTDVNGFPELLHKEAFFERMLFIEAVVAGYMKLFWALRAAEQQTKVARQWAAALEKREGR